MKIALCFRGQHRNFEKCSISFLKNIIPLGVDVYAHLWWHPDKVGENYNTVIEGCNKNYEIENNVIQRFEEIYHPKKLIWDKPILDVPDTLYTSHPTFKLSNFVNVRSCWLSLKKVLESIEEEYDWYILTRTDLDIIQFPDIQTLSDNRIYVGPEWPDLGYIHKDNLYIVPKMHIHIFRNLYDNYEQVYISHRNKDIVEAVGYKSEWVWAGEYTIRFHFAYHKMIHTLTRNNHLHTEIVR
jgi:hypothetical protein